VPISALTATAIRQEKALYYKQAPAAKERFPLACVLALTLAGFVLRLLCARGDLWLDEIWSLQNLAPLHRADEIFYAISQDNNHFLNSVWLFLVGPDAPPQIIRLASIVFGSLTIPVAAKLSLRAGRAAALAAAALTAFGAIFVHYGSEARGYAGFLLMLFCAAEALECYLDDPKSRRHRLGFAASVALGSLFHIAMVEAAAVLGAATLARVGLRANSLKETGAAARDLAVAACIGVLPVLTCLFAGALFTQKIQFGVQVPFSFAGLADGFAGMLDATLGLSRGYPAYLALPVALLWIGLMLLIVRPDRRILPAFTIFVPPFIAMLVQLPNVHIPRFHLIATLGLVLLVAGCVELFWRSRRPFLALAMICVLLAANVGADVELLERGRGDYRTLIASMESGGAGTYASNMEAEVNRTIRFYDARLGGGLMPAPEADWCKAPPVWYVLSDDPEGEAATRTFGPAACPTTFRLQHVMLPAALSGLRFALYRRAGS
jgi:hypothetical protein